MKKVFFLTLSLIAFLIKTQNIICNQVENFEGVNELWVGNIKQYEGWFLYYPSAKQSNKLIIFIGPSPGISAQLMNFLGIGPSILQDDLSLKNNLYSLNNLADLLFLDSFGAGYSRSKEKILEITPQTLADGIAEQIGLILDSDCANIKWKEKQIYLASSNQGVKTMTYIAKQVEQIQGLILLSPIFSVENILRQAPSLAYNLALNNYEQRQATERVALLSLITGLTRNQFNTVLNLIARYGDINVHNINKHQENDDQLVSQFLNKYETRQKLKLDNSWYFFNTNQDLYKAYEKAFPRNDTIQDFSQIIETGKKILIVLNTQSISTNYPGSIQQIENIYWNGKDGLKSLSQVNFQWLENEEGKIYCSSKDIENVSLKVMMQSGEYIWQDQPQNLNYLLQQFLS